VKQVIISRDLETAYEGLPRLKYILLRSEFQTGGAD